MPTDLGTIAAYGTAGGNDELKQLLAERFKRALQAQVEEDRQTQFDIQREQMAAQDRRAAEAEAARKRGSETANVRFAIQQATPEQDLTSLAEGVSKDNPDAQTALKTLTQKANIFPQGSRGVGSTAQGEIGNVGGGPVGIRLQKPPAPDRQLTPESLSPIDFTTKANPAKQSGSYHTRTGTVTDAGGKPVSDWTRYREPTAGQTMAGDAVKLDDEAVADTAMRYHILGASAIPTRTNENDKKRILNQNAKINTAMGQSPAVAIMRGFANKSDASSLTRITQFSEATRAAQAKAEPLADLIEHLSNAVPRTMIEPLNKALLAGERLITSDPTINALENALTEFTAEYAKIVEGSVNSAAGASVDARHRATSLVTSAMAKGTVANQLKQMKQIMAWSVQGYDTTRQSIQERMVGAGTPPPPAATAAPMPPVKDRVAGTTTYTWTTGPHAGKTGTWDGSGWVIK